MLCIIPLKWNSSSTDISAQGFLSAGSHQVNIRVGGASMMARLLRKTVAAFNSSSSLNIHTDNQGRSRVKGQRPPRIPATPTFTHQQLKKHWPSFRTENLYSQNFIVKIKLNNAHWQKTEDILQVQNINHVTRAPFELFALTSDIQAVHRSHLLCRL